MKKLILLMIILVNAVFVSAQTYTPCLVYFNEVTATGDEKTVNILVWFDKVPKIPDYYYFDHKLGKKVKIKTIIKPYKKTALYSSLYFDIIAGDYGEIWIKCTELKDEFLLQDIKEMQSENIGEALAFELEEDTDKRNLTIITFPFERDFPFKYAETIVTKTFSITIIENKCR